MENEKNTVDKWNRKSTDGSDRAHITRVYANAVKSRLDLFPSSLSKLPGGEYTKF